MKEEYIMSFIEADKRGIYVAKRKCGNSTRQIDMIIQLLFQGEKVKVVDENAISSNELFDRLLRRLFREHPAQMKDHVKYDKEKLTIEFI